MRNRTIIVLILMSLILNGCQMSSQSSQVIVLYTSKVEKELKIKDNNDSENKIRVALSSVISPRASLSKYNYLLDYIGKEMDVSIEIIQKQTYEEVDKMLESGEVDIAFICSLSYAIGTNGQYIIDVAAPEIKGRAIYQSYTIVNKNSTYESLEELEGKKFAFTDPYSYTGRLSILSQLYQKGKNPEEYFNHTYFTYSHDYSVNAVALGIVDGATVDGAMFDQLQIENPELSSQIRIIGTGEEAGTPPVVASRKANPTMVAEFTRLLLDLQNKDKGRKILEELGVDRYIPINKEDYKVILENLFLMGETE
ncbi:PhnD/SsuA/transferrin family substrate-binding protein [Bacillus sp. Bva_UNVM-123]|uniref:substrate-binding domain-containing protein n=1 Tax=Bacillus sp. Bva_UNVM-123 TaxID=2829798 RepID=UPI00391F0FFA